MLDNIPEHAAAQVYYIRAWNRMYVLKNKIVPEGKTFKNLKAALKTIHRSNSKLKKGAFSLFSPASKLW